jgi:hypothetical protein
MIHIDSCDPQRGVHKRVKAHVAKARKIVGREPKDMNLEFIPKIVVSEPKVANVKLVVPEEHYVVRVRYVRPR